MAKINFKKLTPLEQAHQPEEDTPKKPRQEEEIPSPEETQIQESVEMEQSVEKIPADQGDESFPFEELETAEEHEKKPARKMRLKGTETADFSADMGDKWGEESSGGFKKFLIFAVILIVLAGAVFGLYQYTGFFKNLPFLSSKSPAPATPVEKAPAVETTPNPLAPEFRINAGINQYLNNSLQQIFASRPPTVRLALLIMTAGEFNLTVLADGADKIAGFKNNLNKAFPSLNFKTISTQEKTLNRNRMIFADLTTRISPSAIPGSDSPVSEVMAPADFNAAVTSLNQKYKLKLEFLKTGLTEDAGSYNQRHFYIVTGGNRDGVLNFIRDISTSYPGARIMKIALSPSNLSTYSDSYLSARINVLYMNPK